MSFPYHDRSWLEAVGVLLAHLHDDDRVLAPDRFWWALPVPVHRWVSANLGDDATFDIVVVHKGELRWVPRRTLERFCRELVPVFANEVFVILASPDRRGVLADPESAHLRSFHELVDGLSEDPTVANDYEADGAIGDAPVLNRFRDLDDDELRRQQDEFMGDGGYRYVTLRDQRYYDDMHDHAAATLARWAGGTVLDVATGSRPFLPVPPGTTIVRTDLSTTAVHHARAADREAGTSKTELRYATADGRALPYRSASFDAAMIIDAVEHVPGIEALLAEVARVLRPGGELLVSYANTDSVNQVMMRALGYPEFVTNHQHVREFDAAEMAGLLADADLEVVETAGVGLLPYWGIPGVDDIVRRVTDDDPAVVEMMSELGALAGDGHAYTGFALARRIS